MPDEALVNDQAQSQSERTIWPGIAAGLPVLLFGLAFILANLPGAQSESIQPWLLFGADGIVLVGVVIGWLGWFPVWTYAFIGMAILFSLWWSTASTGTDSLLSGALAWSPLLVTGALGLILTRSLRPLFKFFQGLLRDWSRASLGLYGVVPLAMYTALGLIPPARAVLFQILAVLFMTAGAGIAGFVAQPRARWRALLLGMSWSWIVVTLGVAIYWPGRLTQANGEMYNWFDQVLVMALIWIILATIVFFPAGMALLGRLARRVTQLNPNRGAG